MDLNIEGLQTYIELAKLRKENEKVYEELMENLKIVTIDIVRMGIKVNKEVEHMMHHKEEL
jgi:hypothetical protein